MLHNITKFNNVSITLVSETVLSRGLYNSLDLWFPTGNPWSTSDLQKIDYLYNNISI